MDSARISARRRLIFRYLSQQLSATEMHPLVNEAYPCSLATIHLDIRKMADWLPGLMNIREGEGDQAFARLVGILHLAQERALQLCYTADNSNAMVGAVRALCLAAKAEADLRMDTGGIPRTPFKLEGGPMVWQAWRPEHLRADVDLEGLDESAIAAIVDNFMNDEARKLRVKENEEEEYQPYRPDDGEPADRSETKAEETRPMPLNGLPENGAPDWVDTSRGGTRIGGYTVRKP